MAKKKKPKTARIADEDAIPKPKLRRVREDEGDEAPPPARSDIFTGLAALSLCALLGAAVFFHLDHEETTAKSLAAPSITVPSAAGVTDAPRGKAN